MSYIFRKILWIDSLGAIVTGILLLLLNGWIAPLFGVPNWFVIGHAFVHLAYGSYSLSLAVRRHRPMILIKFLVIANASWAIICFVLIGFLVGNSTVFAVVHFLLEGLYVGSLALIEWTVRHQLQEAENYQ
jgi:hypothetical protein